MRTTLSILTLLAIGAPAALTGQSGVVVGGFETDGSVGLTRDEYQAIGRALTDLLRTGLGASAAPVSVEPTSTTRPGRVDLGAARAAATAAGARYLVVGSLLDQYGDIKVQARIIDAMTGQPIAVIRGDPAIDSREKLADAIVALTARLAAEPQLGARATRPIAGGIPITALIAYGRGLGFEAAGDRPRAAAAYREAASAAPGFSEATAALSRVGG
ncbi:MAG TPA: hypothetical protein VFN22_02870 [Gemmatimonadales bacterium]|nr:hypothetical protein [Gemmatimonadales bacterium]